MNVNMGSSFLTEYLRVSPFKVLQLEVHPLDIQTNTSRRHIWFANRHLQEIVQLIKDIVIKRVSLTKDFANTTSQLLSGETVRLGYAFKKKTEKHTCLILRDNLHVPYREASSSEDSDLETVPIAGRYQSYEVHGEKMIVYVLPNEKGNQGFQKIQCALSGQKKPQSISSYFVRSPQVNNSDVVSKSQPGAKNSKRTLQFEGDKRGTAAGSATVESGTDYDKSSQEKSYESCETITIEDNNSVDGTDIPAKVKPPASSQEKKNQTIKETIQRFNNKLSTKFTRKPRLKQKPSGQLMCSDSLPDICVPSDSVPSPSTSPIKHDDETSSIPASSQNSSKETADSSSPKLSKKYVSRNRPLFGLIGPEPTHTDNPFMGGVAISDEDNKDTPTSPTFKKRIIKRPQQMSEICSESISQRKKRKSTDCSDLAEKPEKCLKTACNRLVKGKSYQNSAAKIVPQSPKDSVKKCVVSLEKLSDLTLMQSSSSKKTLPCSTNSVSRNRRVSKRISQVFEQCERIAELTDMDSIEDDVILLEPKSCEHVPSDTDEQVEEIRKSISSVKSVSDLNLQEITYLVHQSEDYLRSISQGKMYCRRHEDYKTGGKTKRDLNYQLYFGDLSDAQCDCIMDTLILIFCKNHKKYRHLNYLFSVLLPEMIVKTYMDVWQVEHEKAEIMIQSTRQGPLPVSVVLELTD